MEAPTRVKAYYLQFLLLLAALIFLSYFFRALGLVFVPLNAYASTIIIIGITIYLTIRGARSKDRSSFLPVLLPPLSGFFVVQTVLINPLGFAAPMLLSFVVGVCCFVLFVMCARRIVHVALNILLAAAYIVAIFICGFWVLILGVWGGGFPGRPSTFIGSPNGTATAEISSGGFDNQGFVVMHNTGTNVLIGRVSAPPQRFWVFDGRGRETSVYWVNDGFLKVYHRGTIYMHITHDGRRWLRPNNLLS